MLKDIVDLHGGELILPEGINSAEKNLKTIDVSMRSGLDPVYYCHSIKYMIASGGMCYGHSVAFLINYQYGDDVIALFKDSKFQALTLEYQIAQFLSMRKCDFHRDEMDLEEKLTFCFLTPKLLDSLMITVDYIAPDWLSIPAMINALECGLNKGGDRILVPIERGRAGHCVAIAVDKERFVFFEPSGGVAAFDCKRSVLKFALFLDDYFKIEGDNSGFSFVFLKKVNEEGWV